MSHHAATHPGIHWKADVATHTSSRATSLERSFIFALGGILAGYALLGRGFAYLGVAPLFVGEMTLALGALAWFSRERPMAPLKSLSGTMLALFMAIGLVRLAFDLPTYGPAAIRDAVLWGYGVYALALAAIVSREPEILRTLITRFRPLAAAIIALGGALFAISFTFSASLPSLPGSTAPIPGLKGGDTMVHLAGAVAFVLVGFRTKIWWMLPMVVVDFGLIAMKNRGGMVAFFLAMGVVLFLRSSRVRIGRWSYLGLVGILLLILINPKVELYGNRSISLEQLGDNIRSVTGSSGENALDGSKEWRLSWWTDIVEYTFTGPYFLAGKGFGINLASDDGYQVDDEESLRSPHNGHMSVLARMGVPAFAIWVMLQLSWGFAILRNLLVARRRGEDGWHGLFLFLLAYWCAFMVNITFDVFIEGPMGGIWFWTLFGIGLGAVNVYNQKWVL
jgi:O-Antigen ligase